MPEKKDIIITFDYELFLGSRSGTVENCILIPTQKLLGIFERNGVTRAIFFVDTTYLLRLRQNTAEACQKDFARIAEQIRAIVRAGHYVFPHLHTHWLDAIYLPEINQWDLSETRRYSMSDVSEEEREKIFSDSVGLLRELCGEQHELGYRAGGWCIQPFRHFKPLFEKHNVRFDFSVMKGYCCNAPFQYFDFRQSPFKPYYKFSDQVIEEDANGAFTEIAISTVRIRNINRLLNKFFMRLLNRRGIRNYGDGNSTLGAALKEIKPFGYEMASIELLTIVNLGDYFKKIAERDYLQFISHPKMLSPHNLTCFEVLLKKILEKYTVNTDFKNLVTRLN
jgi:hypothetical protein